MEGFYENAGWSFHSMKEENFNKQYNDLSGAEPILRNINHINEEPTIACFSNSNPYEVLLILFDNIITSQWLYF